MDTTGAASPHEPNAARRRLSGHLAGAGVEVGPGPYPFRLLPPGVRVRYVDQQGPGVGSGRHAPTPQYVAPDIVADFNTDRLGALPDGSEDFVIASHVLEHLAEPLGFIEDMHRVLRPGGHALILLPDRHRTEDRFRRPTPLQHLVAEFDTHVQDVSDDHVVEFLKDRGIPLRGTSEDRRSLLEWHKKQSIHVHCWDAVEFLPVLVWGIEHLGQRWEFVDGCLYEPPIHYEFGYLLRRAQHPEDAPAMAARLTEDWTAWRDAQVARRPEVLRRGTGSHHLPRVVYRTTRRVLRNHRLVARVFQTLTGRRPGGR